MEPKGGLDPDPHYNTGGSETNDKIFFNELLLIKSWIFLFMGATV